MAKKPGALSLLLTPFPLVLKQRLKLEAIRKNASTTEIVIDILNDKLPLFEEILSAKYP